MKKESNCITENKWNILREYTEARIGLGRVGVNIPTNELLAFELAHAQAQDAVHLPLDVNLLSSKLNDLPIDLSLLNKNAKKEGILQKGYESHLLHSQAQNRNIYLQRPDLGRKLDENSKDILKKINTKNKSYDLSIIIVDGLSSLAIKENAINYIKKLTNSLAQSNNSWYLAPLMIVEQGRVAIGDEIGEILNAKCVIVLIGERPGLSSPDSLGLYLTYNPKVGLNDSFRNCISNIRKEGLSYDEAVNKSIYLLNESRKLKFSGVNLKERTQENIINNNTKNEKNFLLT